ncbi:Armadillo-like helical-containing protein [Dioscorea alata]|uniref:Armadillo-like helical-containing protein n=1 Tax=Dioscorea alata TaxID=55571 RepID=A0ACB7UWV0_DIOAL|nr:Armadillo-like helical-containing protein [Dioscorea alata]
METEISGTYRYMGRSLSDAGGDSSGAFSDCNSDHSGEFSPSAAGGGGAALRLLVPFSAGDYSEDDLRALIAELESPTATVEAQRGAAMEIRLLAKHSSENRLRIARAGAVRPLVALLSSPDPLLQEHGVTAILNLSLLDENKDLITAAGAIKPLVRALRSASSAARENAACALLRLSYSDALKAAIARSGAIPPLVSMLESGGARAKKDAATALYALCSVKENKIRAVEAGIVRPLLEMMAETEGGMVDKAGCVLGRVATEEVGRAAAVEEGGIPVLVEVVEIGTQRQKEIATSTLLEICDGSSNGAGAGAGAGAYRALVVREGAIPPLVALSQSGTSRAKQKAEKLIELLRQPRTAAGRVVDE